MTNMQQQQAPRFYRIDEICAELSLSKTTIRQLMRDAGFPQPQRFSQRTVRWLRTDVDAWLASRSGAVGK